MQRTLTVLNVAEKNSIAKQVSAALSNNSATRGSTCSNYNPLFSFPYALNGMPCEMLFTSVAGHLMELDFPEAFKKWHSCSPLELYGAPVLKCVPQDKKLVERNLKEQARKCQWLVLWLDCDREGENIAFEVIDVCIKANPRLLIKRAKFSALVRRELERSVQNLGVPDENLSKAVDARQEIDLRIGASFTRFQTLLLQEKFNWEEHGIHDERPIFSYGPCQFPTLGLIVQRQWEIQAHVAEPFWYIYAMYRAPEGQSCTLHWQRDRLYDHVIATILYETCVDAPLATVTKVDARQKLRWPPLPLATLSLQKEAITHLRLPGERMMKLAEELYQEGFISYPRTETDVFDPAYDLKALVREHVNDARWGQHAQRIDSGEMWAAPRGGGHDDHAHPPIHPTRWSAPDANQGWDPNKRRLYEFIVRSFLASCSKPAVGFETQVEVTIAAETFRTTGLMVKERNWMEVFPWARWGGNDNLPVFAVNQTFMPTELLLKDGMTQPPPKMSERDLISAMERHGIGTDATVADHIQKQLDRGYALKDAAQLFSPTALGEALVASYHKMGLSNLWQPTLRGAIEHNITEVARGLRPKQEVLDEAVQHFRGDYIAAAGKQAMMLEEVGRFFGPRAGGGGPGEAGGALPPGDPIGACASCGLNLMLCQPAEGTPFVACSGAPLCRQRVYFPRPTLAADISDQPCATCQLDRGGLRKISFRLRRAAIPPGFEADMVACVLCDQRFKDLCEACGTARPAGQRNNQARGGGGQARGRGRGPAGRCEARASVLTRCVELLRGRGGRQGGMARGPPVCPRHGQPCLVKTSNSAANPGRTFFKCAHPSEAQECLDFMWEDEWNGQPLGASRARRTEPRGRGGNRGHGPRGAGRQQHGGRGNAGGRLVDAATGLPLDANEGSCYKCGQRGHWANACPN
ncbi:prokaryotic type I DNA topoisomerase [Coccomyxa subellipsoidea C-169]|uniref:DNA topoisomerase n=1 Tax=Coccomyxa subellipsoidea (strain C-169) TaxID=574566 RepID=I0ZA53_COCSC|nr:prokaryotic type I DNA topoisomerase [Coccomyxa subellipsoidea C-169]EIE27522.1 prokaryotic type I DNA topoisomerase [Coccomyxa subellipsoidea C-169]|eukprot:XP_005652066.1 prokaryotic type I DNA topoisomerase [Coccomyxa subellipsoidea C-169]